MPQSLHPDVFVAETSMWLLDPRPKPDALFMQIGLPGPHPLYIPLPEYLKHYLARNDLPVAEPKQSDLDDLPAYLKEKRRQDVEVDHDVISWKLLPTRDEMRRLHAHYYANVTMIDEQISLLLTTLDRKGYLDDCVIVFMFDHGDNLGEHGLSQKWSMYKSVKRVPALFWAPCRLQGGRRVKEKCQLFDLGSDDPRYRRCETSRTMSGAKSASSPYVRTMVRPRVRVQRAGERCRDDRRKTGYDGA